MFAGGAGVSDAVTRGGVAVADAEELGSGVDIYDGGRKQTVKQESFKFVSRFNITRTFLLNERVRVWADLGLREKSERGLLSGPIWA